MPTIPEAPYGGYQKGRHPLAGGGLKTRNIDRKPSVCDDARHAVEY